MMLPTVASYSMRWPLMTIVCWVTVRSGLAVAGAVATPGILPAEESRCCCCAAAPTGASAASRRRAARVGCMSVAGPEVVWDEMLNLDAREHGVHTGYAGL